MLVVVFLPAMVLFVVGILFGYQVNDRYWLPRPDQNYLSWGFGFMVISMICTLAAGVLLFKAAWVTYQELLRREDEYTKQALEMSAAGIELGTYPDDNQLALVHPGFSSGPPGFSASFGRPIPPPENDPSRVPDFPPKQPLAPPSYSDVNPSLSPSSQPTSDDKVALMSKPREPDMWAPVPAGASAGYDQGLPEPSPGMYGRGFDVKDLDGYGKSFDQPSVAYGGKSYEQPSRFGKSYDRNYEKHFSDTSFNDPNDDSGPVKPERHY